MQNDADLYDSELQIEKAREGEQETERERKINAHGYHISFWVIQRISGFPFLTCLTKKEKYTEKTEDLSSMSIFMDSSTTHPLDASGR